VKIKVKIVVKCVIVPKKEQSANFVILKKMYCKGLKIIIYLEGEIFSAPELCTQNQLVKIEE